MSAENSAPVFHLYVTHHDDAPMGYSEDEAPTGYSKFSLEGTVADELGELYGKPMHITCRDEVVLEESEEEGGDTEGKGNEEELENEGGKKAATSTSKTRYTLKDGKFAHGSEQGPTFFGRLPPNDDTSPVQPYTWTRLINAKMLNWRGPNFTYTFVPHHPISLGDWVTKIQQSTENFRSSVPSTSETIPVFDVYIHPETREFQISWEGSVVEGELFHNGKKRTTDGCSVEITFALRGAGSRPEGRTPEHPQETTADKDK